MSASLIPSRPRLAMLLLLFLIPLLALVMVFDALAAPAAAPAASATGPANDVEPVLYVKPGAGGGCTSWLDACELQTALGAAVSGQQIWVAEGLYKPTAAADRTVSFVLKQGVALYGGFAGDEAVLADRDWTTHITVLSGDIDNNDVTDGNGILADTDAITGTNSYHVLNSNFMTETARLDGFTITGGYADSGTWNSNAGGGMFGGNGSPTLANLLFQGNYAGNGGGGGIRLDGGFPEIVNVRFVANESLSDGGGLWIGFGSDPNLTQVTFLNNKASVGAGAYMIGDSEATFNQVNFVGNQATIGAGLFSRLSNPRLNQVLFQDNHSTNYGGGMAILLEGTPRLSDVTFVGNTATNNGGGLYNAIDSSPVLTRTTFISNSSTYGGGLQQQGGATITMTNSTFNGNSASQFGGAIRFVEAATSATLNNVTFSANSAASQGGAIYNSAATVTINNSTFSANQADIGGALANAGGGKPNLNNLVMWGNTATTSDPQILASSPVTVSDGLIEGGCAVNCSGTILDQNPQFQRDPSDGGDGWGVGDNDDYGDLRIKPGSPAEDAGNNALVPGYLNTDHDGAMRIVDAAVDLGAFEIPASLARYYVDQSVQQPADGSEWAKAFPNLQTALVYAQPGTEVWVADGHYNPGLSRQDTFRLLSDVAVYGGFEGTESVLSARSWDDFITVLSGDIFGDDQVDKDGLITDTAGINGPNNYHVTWGAPVSQTSRLDGFFITGGNADSTWPNNGGGGMFVGTGSPTLANLLIQGNFAGAGGGGMRMDGGSPNISDVTFEGNRTSYFGGGLYVGPASQPSLTNSAFVDNDAPAGGGGGLYLIYVTDMTMDHVTFHGNHSSYDGGAIFLHGSNPRLNQVTFEENQAGADGGAIVLTLASAPVLTDTTFIRNTGLNGGAMALYGGSSPLLTGVTFEDNQSVQYGGGIYSTASHPVLIDVTFDGNQTGPGYYGGGGIFSDDGSNPRLTRVDFIHNRAEEWGGGGMGIDSGSHPVLTDTTFISNTAAAWGGGLTINDGSTMAMTRALFRDNRIDANAGGGMYIGLSSHGSLIDVVFEGNHAPSAGGGLYIEYNSSPLLANVLFTLNSASIGGGLSLYDNANPTLVNTTFSGNNATNTGGGLGTENNSNPIIQNSIFYSNTAPLGAQVYNLDTSTPTFAFSLVQGSGGSAAWTGPGTDLGGNIDGDPLFVRNPNPGLDDYGDLRLKGGSPAVDTGNNAFVPPGLMTDLDGNPRIFNDVVDMGAYEFYNYFLYLPVVLK